MPQPRTHLATLEMQNQIDGKLDIIVENRGYSGNPFKIIVSCSEEFEGQTITATHAEGGSFTATVEEGTATLEVDKPGKWTITNSLNEDEFEVNIDNVTDGSFFVKKATINVTVPESLIGYTITCKKDAKTLEKIAESTTVSFDVPSLGQWIIGVKGVTSVNVTVDANSESTFSATINLDSGIPLINVTTSIEINNKVLKCTKSQTVLTQTVKNKKATFLVPETGEWVITCEDFPEKQVKVNVAENKPYSARFSTAHIYGVKVKQEESDPETRVEYIEGAADMTPVSVSQDNGTVNYNGWDDTWIFEKIYPVMLKKDGTEDYKLNPNDYSKKLGGGNSDIADINYNGNAMVCIEKMYIKFYEDAGYEYYLISDEPEDGFKPVGFTRADGSEMDKAYMAMFKGCFDSSNNLRSISGQQIRNQTSYTDFRAAAQQYGENYNLEPHSLITVLDAIYLILFKNENSQKACGRGRDYGTDDSAHHAMSIKTGILNTSGPIGYDTDSQGVKFMHIEDYWTNNAYWWMDGWLYKNNEIYLKFNQPYSDSDVSGYTKVTGNTPGNGYISKSIAKTEYGRIPNEFSGSDSTYECDNGSTNPNNETGTIYACHRADYGVWFRFNPTVSFTSTCLGAALSYEPPKVA